MVQPVPEIRPSVGFCIQTESLGSPAGRWYLNMTRHKAVQMPIAHSGKPITKDFIFQHGIGSMKIPFDMGSFRKLKERAEGHKQTAYCVDVVFNPFIIQMFMDDDFNKTMAEYRPFIINLALGRIESSIGVKLSAQKVKLVKKFLYKDGEGNSGETPREFTELPQEMEMDSMEEMAPPPPKPKAAQEEKTEPLIQDVTPGKKPALKKGFFNSAKGAELYPNGSNEGVLPENAGDPMGWMPKKLRQTSRIVDCNSPEYQAQEKQRKAAEAQNAQQKEFHDMLQADLGRWQKNDNHWNQDLPDGAEDTNRKYSNDYSRFDAVPDVEATPTVEERDWYYDSNGQRQQISKGAPTAASSAAADGKPAIKKGFFDNAKAPLYPKGSEQRAPLDDKELLKQMGDLKMDELLGSEVDMKDMASFFKDMPFDPPEREASKTTSQAEVKAVEKKAPDFTLDRAPDDESQLHLVVSLPGLESMQGVDLDVTDSCASLAFPASMGVKPLQVELPEKVLPGSVRAKFSKKTRQITVKMPLAT